MRAFARRAAIATNLTAALACSTLTRPEVAFRCPPESSVRVAAAAAWCEADDRRADGTAMTWDDRGHLLSGGEFRAGRAVSSVVFYETGEVAVVRRKVGNDPPRELDEHFYPDGARAGTWKFWSQDGALREVDHPATPGRVDPPAAPAP